jgi:signal peptidase I
MQANQWYSDAASPMNEFESVDQPVSNDPFVRLERQDVEDSAQLEAAAAPPSPDVLSISEAPLAADAPVADTPIVADVPPVANASPVIDWSLHGGTWRRVASELVAGARTLLSAAVYATIIVTFGFQVARVDGLSMAPTLEDRDRLIVNKLVYELGDPRPGDIVMLYYPRDPQKMFVKRVIAKEGDTVRIVDGRVYVNDIALHDDYVPAEFRSHDDWGPTVVDQGYYFVMGDHRNNSSDSRHWGSVPKKYIVGKVKVRWWPIQDVRIF